MENLGEKMLEIAIMIEGQNGLTWSHWQRLVKSVEELGFIGLYRSDHYTNASPPDLESLELWTSLTWLASHTKRIEFGPLVSPVSFRNPTLTARIASAVDDLSGGRLILGMGAGWQEREHTNYGWELLSVLKRFKRFEEALEIMTRMLNSDEPFEFHGEYYDLHEAILLPRPHRPGGPPILIGGNGPRRTLPLAAKFAAEWNSVYLPIDKFKELNSLLDEMIESRGRKIGEVRRSMMTGCEFGRSDAEVKELVRTRTEGKSSVRELIDRGLIVGTGSQIIDQLGNLAEAGLQRIMLQWLALDDIERLEDMAKEILPHSQH
jgi:F420-dependent oxidoreductase-like protein